MIKKMFQAVLGLLSFYASALLASWAEFGSQLMVPGFRTNSAYDSLGPTKYVFVMATGAYQANLATSALSSNILGVLQNGPAIQEAMSIAYAGPSKVVAGGAISANAIITTNASGRAAVVASGQMACGRLLEAAVNDGDVVSALLFHPVRWGNV